MLAELSLVVLTRDIPDAGLRRGDAGTVVHVYADGDAYEVEFTALDGSTFAVKTVDAEDLRAAGPRDLSHAREVA